MRDIFFQYFDKEVQHLLAGPYDTQIYADEIEKCFKLVVLMSEESEQQIIVPPAFLIESNISRNIAQKNMAFFDLGYVSFPIRENDLTEYYEKKEEQYSGIKAQYSNYFDISIKKSVQRATEKNLVKRDTRIGDGISRLWKEDVTSLQVGTIGQVLDKSEAPKVKKELARLDQKREGSAFVWEFVERYLKWTPLPVPLAA